MNERVISLRIICTYLLHCHIHTVVIYSELRHLLESALYLLFVGTYFEIIMNVLTKLNVLIMFYNGEFFTLSCHLNEYE